MMRALLIALILLLPACGGDSTGTGSSANVKITGVGVSSVSVENIGGSGDFYLEFWGHHYINPPSGTPNPVILLSSSAVVSVAAGYRATIGNPVSATKI